MVALRIGVADEVAHYNAPMTLLQQIGKMDFYKYMSIYGTIHHFLP